MSAGTCNRDVHSTSWHAVAASNMDRVSSNSVSVDCPNKQECPDKNTCCLLQSGTYGCCPYFQVLITSHCISANQGPDLQNIIRQSYDKVMTMTEVMTNHTTDAIYKKII